MKRYLKFIGIIILFAMLPGCDNSLEEKVFSSIAEQSYNFQTKDLAASVAGVYPPLRYYCFAYCQTQEITGNAIVMPPNSTGWDDGGIYRKLHYHTWNSELNQVSALWDQFYRGALLSTNAINLIQSGVIPGSEQERAAAVAEVRAARAYYYWILMDNFGDIPIVTTKTTELPSATPRAEVFAFLVKELTESIPLLSEEQAGKQYGRINKWAGKTLLANLYLNGEVYTGQSYWDECLEQCSDIINSGMCNLSTNYKDSFRATGVETSKEVLFTIPYDFSLNAVGNYLFMNSWHSELKKKYLTVLTPNGAGSMKAIPQFINTYQDGDSRLPDTWLTGLQFSSTGDTLRGAYNLAGKPLIFSKEIPDGNFTNEMEGYRMNKFEVAIGSNWSCNTDIPLFRYSEVLLMKAECLLRKNQPGAGALVTEVRSRAFLNDPSKATVTDAELKNNSSYVYGFVENYVITAPGDQSPIMFGRMLDELGWEFVWEGHTRRDLIRFGVFTKKSWLSHKPEGTYRSVFPIPQTALNTNKNLKQTAGY